MIPKLERLQIRLADGIAQIALARPDKANAMDAQMFWDIGQAFDWLDRSPEARVAVLSGQGRHFCAGLDHSVLATIRPAQGTGRDVAALRRQIMAMQAQITKIEACRKPVIAAIQGACIGGGLDIAAACDLRLMSQDARISLKEVDLGIIADVGVLQRLPHLIGEGRTRDLAFTARTFDAQEALSMGLAQSVWSDPAALQGAAMALAAQLAAKSPLALQGTKEVMTRRLHPAICEGLEHVATLNAGVMFSEDLDEVMAALGEKRPPQFPDL